MKTKRVQRSRELTDAQRQRLHEFPSEDNAASAIADDRWRHLHNRRAISTALIGVVALTVLTLWWFRSTASGAETATGFLTVMSEPERASVLIDGQVSGTTPISVTLRAGAHRLLVRHADHSREVSITLAANMSTVYHFTWSDEASTSTSGGLRVVTDGPQGSVTLDKQPRGSTPLTINNLAVGDHDVVLVRNGITYQHTVRVEPGAITSLIIGSSSTAGPESGWLSVTAAIPLQILEDGKVVGNTASDRILMPAGEHTLDFDDAAVGFRVSRKVSVVAGRTQKVAIELPQAQISMNARPWAEVWIDGRALGETPIGNLATTIGSHEVVFRHPQLGERRVTAIVTTKEVARIAVDMRRSQ
jgi:hypothetical protein